MMIVNGWPAANKTVWQESVNVTANTSYSFSGWVASWGQTTYNVVNGNGIDPSPAQLAISINGVPVGSTVQVNSQDGQWQNFGAAWNSGSNSQATITIVDLNTQDQGNDFALDDFSFDGQPTVVPEPATLAPAILGILMTAAWRWRITRR